MASFLCKCSTHQQFFFIIIKMHFIILIVHHGPNIKHISHDSWRHLDIYFHVGENGVLQLSSVFFASQQHQSCFHLSTASTMFSSSWSDPFQTLGIYHMPKTISNNKHINHNFMQKHFIVVHNSRENLHINTILIYAVHGSASIWLSHFLDSLFSLTYPLCS
jgi:hypothetical protein